MIFAGIVIVSIMFLTILYTLHTIGKHIILTRRKRKLEGYFISQTSNFTVSPLITFNKKEDLFSKATIENAGTVSIKEKFEIVDYTKNVPWFLHY